MSDQLHTFISLLCTSGSSGWILLVLGYTAMAVLVLY